LLCHYVENPESAIGWIDAAQGLGVLETTEPHAAVASPSINESTLQPDLRAPHEGR
jgi:hypothetical protein